jgi:hypothetical protein
MGNMGSKGMIIFSVVLGLLLMVIGIGARHSNVSLAGQFIFSAALISGGLQSEEPAALRVTLIAIGGLFAISAFAGSGASLASLIPSLTGR